MLKNFDSLPIDKHREEIIDTINKNQVVVIAGDTGSGKTTRIPQFCLELESNSPKQVIGCTQPRRLAAISVSERVAFELNDQSKVNYKIRFHDKTTSSTQIKFMTDGVLLAETKNDPLLKKYSVLIIDEAHERNRNIDFLLGYISNLLKKRNNLKLVITSATIDTISFAKHFNNAPIISIEGRTYPVELRYEPLVEGEEDYLDHCVKTVDNLFITDRPADTLIFLPTEKDIRSCCDLLSKTIKNVDILPLFGRLQSGDQKQIFKQNSKTKIVVATNIAETSITVPGIRYVVDSGLARMTYYNPRSKTTSLPIQKISIASCDQRKGRCGRIAPGVCIRLFEEEDYLKRDQYTLPEIKRSNLAEVLLQMASLRLGDPLKFPFLNPPTPNSIKDGYSVLRELGAIDNKYNLTKRGKLMSELPIDPCISRILIEANSNNCLADIKIIASVLAIQDPRIRPTEKEKEADLAHGKFSHKHSDFMALLNIWNAFHDSKEKLSWSRLKKFCKSNYLSFQRMREWFDLHEQLSRILNRYDEFNDSLVEPTYDQIHKSLLSGFLRNIALRQDKKIYQGSGNKELMVFPGSHQFQTSGQWIMAADFLETNRLYALTVASIEPEWIEPLAANLCKYNWTSPHWEKKTGQVVADEKVTLFGLVIIASRKVNFGKKSAKNQKEAQNIFIESALLAGEVVGNYPFLKHNLKLVRKWQKTEDRLRKRDILQSDLVFHQFYSENLPETVYDRPTLNKWLKKHKNPKHLFMHEQDILLRTPEQSEFSDFPTEITVSNITLKVSYKFNPSGTRDGLTVHIPIALAETFSESQFDWLVSGFLHEKITFLLKGLPKSLRKKLVPVNLAVEKILDDISQDFGVGNFYAKIENSILKLYKFNLQRNDWPSPLPDYLQPKFVIENDSGRKIAEGSTLSAILKKQNTKNTVESIAKPSKEHIDIINIFKVFETDTWDFENLPDSIPLYLPNNTINGFTYPFPKKVPNRNKVTICFSENKKEAMSNNQAGTLNLYKFQLSSAVKALKKSCSNVLSAPSALWLVKGYVNKNEAVESMLNFILYSVFKIQNIKTLPSKSDFFTTLDTVEKNGLLKIGNNYTVKFAEISRLRAHLEKTIHSLPERRTNNTIKTRNDFLSLLKEIAPSYFFDHYTADDIEDCVRQLSCLEIRLERYTLNPLKDLQKEKPLLPHLDNLASLTGKELHEDIFQLMEDYKILINEFKISAFSPEIRTKLPVSEKKLNAKWQKIKGYI